MKPPADKSLIPIDGWNGQFYLGPRHTYWYKDLQSDGQLAAARPLSGITSVLKAIGGAKTDNLLKWAATCAVDFIRQIHSENSGIIPTSMWEAGKTAHLRKRDGAADLGKLEHEKLETYIKECIELNNGWPMQVNLDDPTLQRVGEFSGWAVKAGVRFIASEMPLADPVLAIAGTPDFIAENRDSRVIIGDLKTGKGIYDRTYFAQMAAYGYMYDKKVGGTGDNIAQLVIIHCPAAKPEQPLTDYWSNDLPGDRKGFEAALYLHRWLDKFQPKN